MVRTTFSAIPDHGHSVTVPHPKKDLGKGLVAAIRKQAGLKRPGEEIAMRYPVVIEPGSADTAYGVVVPDLPGCFSAGDTLDEAVGNAAVAAALWMEDAIDRKAIVPTPSPLDAIRARDEWSGCSFGFVTVDTALFDDAAERVNITLPRRVLARLDARAKAAGESRSGFIATLALLG